MKLNKKTNKSILFSTYIFLAVFIGLIGYLIYFNYFQAENIINNPYNTRQEILAKKVKRGDILASDGSILATTITDADGTEVRYYPNQKLLCHVLGYVGNGGSGLENSAAYYMLTSHENFIDLIANDLSGEKNQGDNVYTTLDLGLSKVAYEALGTDRGSVIVLEPSTGRILTMVSTPDFDPNTVGTDWDSIVADNTNSVLINRATQGLYPPGSTFKLATLLQYYRENGDSYDQFKYTCDGHYEINGTSISCIYQTAHGTQNISQAFANSCNGAFITMGLTLNKNSYQKTVKDLLFNSKLPLNMEFNESSFVLNEASSDWETAQTSFGQGETLVTPMHLALITSAIANDGVLMKPYLVEKVTGANGKDTKSFKTVEYGELISKEEAEFLTDNMELAVNTSFSAHFSGLGYGIAGKSGTAQYGTSGLEHSLFLSFSPTENPEIVVVVVLEGGERQNEHAVIVAKKIYEYYYHK